MPSVWSWWCCHSKTLPCHVTMVVIPVLMSKSQVQITPITVLMVCLSCETLLRIAVLGIRTVDIPSFPFASAACSTRAELSALTHPLCTLACCSTLTSLSISSTACELQQCDVMLLGRLRGLQELTLRFPGHADGTHRLSISPLSRLTNLQRLVVQGVHPTGSEEAAAAAAIGPQGGPGGEPAAAAAAAAVASCVFCPSA